MRVFLSLVFLFAAVGIISVSAQTTEFTYQGSLQNSSAPATGSFDFEFLLFDAVTGGTQLGATLTRSTVAVSAGTFAVKLDFGPQFPGSNRFLEIHVRTTGGGAYTPLAPRQSVGSSPYSVQSLNAANATTATNATNATQLGGVAASGFIQNTTSPQSTSNFNISGTGTANIFNAASQYNIGGNRFLSGDSASGNVFAGVFAGSLNSTGGNNSFFGREAGPNNTTGSNNSFFGTSSGFNNTVGTKNSFVGIAAGSSNTIGTNNSALGYLANFSANNLTNSTTIGSQAYVSQSNSLVLGSINNINGASSGTNVGIGISAPSERLHVVGNGLFTGNLTASAINASTQFNIGGSHILSIGSDVGAGNLFSGVSAGQLNAGGISNSFFGARSGFKNLSGTGNSFFGVSAGHDNTTGGNNAFVGATAGLSNTTGNGNSFFGDSSGLQNTIGERNAFFGLYAGESNITGVGNTALGYLANFVTSNLTNATAIGNQSQVNCSNCMVLGSINGVNASTFDTNVGIGTTAPAAKLHVNGLIRLDTLGVAGSTPLCHNGSNQISTCSSSARYKNNINAFTSGLDLIKRLRPVSFNWKDGGMRDMGLVAEEVNAVEPLLTTTNASGQVEGVKYDRIGVVLINAVKDQQAQIESLEKQNELQQKQIEQQRKQIDSLTKIVCAINSKADICRQ